LDAKIIGSKNSIPRLKLHVLTDLCYTIHTHSGYTLSKNYWEYIVYISRHALEYNIYAVVVLQH